MEYNDEQIKIINEAYDFYYNSSKQVYEFSGGPGTGKSTIMLGILDKLKLNRNSILSMAHIGQAAINMRLKGLPNAKTIFSSIYEFKKVISDDYDTYYNRPKIKFIKRDKDLSNINLMFIDEGYSVPLSLKHDIEKHNIKIIVAGDVDQLKPVMDKPAYLTNIDNITKLTKCIRQEENSGIVYLYKRALGGYPLIEGKYGNAIVINDDEVTNSILHKANVIICGTNKKREYLTNIIRNDILKINSELPTYNESVLFRKNDWTIENSGINITNGLRGKIKNNPSSNDIRNGNFIVNFNANNLDCTFERLQCDYEYLISSYKDKVKLKFRKNNSGQKLEFGYALTCHMTQGSEYESGIFFDDGFIGPDYKNYMYTGISRFKKNVIIVKRKKRYY